MTKREEAIREVVNMSDKDRMEFYKKEMEIQISIVFEISRENLKLRNEIKELEK
jgi:hypothetical protein